MYLNVEFKKSLKNSKLYECNCKGTKIEWMNKQLAKQKNSSNLFVSKG